MRYWAESHGSQAERENAAEYGRFLVIPGRPGPGWVLNGLKPVRPGPRMGHEPFNRAESESSADFPDVSRVEELVKVSGALVLGDRGDLVPDRALEGRRVHASQDA